jgi:hypothetical protein
MQREADYRHPGSQGGKTTVENGQVASRACKRRKAGLSNLRLDRQQSASDSEPVAKWASPTTACGGSLSGLRYDFLDFRVPSDVGLPAHPLGVIGRKPTRKHRIQVRRQRSDRLQFRALKSTWLGSARAKAKAFSPISSRSVTGCWPRSTSRRSTATARWYVA